MEPEHGAIHLCQKRDQQIASDDMGPLVREDRAELLGRPVPPRSRQQNPGSDHSGRQRCRDRGRLVDRRAPFVGHERRGSHEEPREMPASSEPDQQDGDAGEVDRQQQGSEAKRDGGGQVFTRTGSFRTASGSRLSSSGRLPASFRLSAARSRRANGCRLRFDDRSGSDCQRGGNVFFCVVFCGMFSSVPAFGGEACQADGRMLNLSGER